MSEINMTPLIDVMLVLLVIFIISAPLMASSLKLELPKAQAPAGASQGTPLRLALDDKGQLFIDDAPASLAQVQDRAKLAARKDPATEVHLRADQRVPYGRVAELIGLVQQAGLTRIGFVTQAPEAQAKP